MYLSKSTHFYTVMLIFVLIGFMGCSDKNDVIGPAPFPTDAVVFKDEFGSTVTFQAFAGSKLDAVQIDQIETYAGSQSLVITVPDSGDVTGSYAGGAFTSDIARDLSGYNAVTFWAKASKAASMNVAGIGNDNTGTSIYTAEVSNLALTTSWQKYTIPFPLPEKLTTEQGLFYFAEGPENGSGYQIWIDEIIFENTNTVTNPRPDLGQQEVDVEAGETINIGNGLVTFNVDGTDLDVSAMSAYFTFTSSNTGIVAIGANGVVTATGVGTASLTASLGEVNAAGSVTVNVSAPQAVPTTAAPSPTVDPSNVVSLFSDSYTDVTVNLWSADWDIADVEDITIGADNVKKYYNLTYAGIVFENPTVDASAMTHIHMDIWTPNPTGAPAVFKIKLVDFGPNDVYNEGGGDDSEHELVFYDNYLTSESWISIDVPLASFTNLATTGNMAQLIISGSLNTVYVDNIYFYNGNLQPQPTSPAPAPSVDAADVISLFSDSYTNVSVDTWSAVYDNADVEDFVIGSDSTKKYTNLVFAAIEFRNNTIDATAMTHIHMDLWTPDAANSQSLFKIKLVDFGVDGVSGGGDDVNHEITLGNTTINSYFWVSIDIPLSNFSNLTTTGHLGQLIISGDLNTVFLDNIYFYDSGIPTAPPVSAPTPSHDAADVISLFSDAYTNVTVDTWSADHWPDEADVADYTIGSDNLKKYTNLVYAGIEFLTNTVDVSTMTHFHIDLWTPDPTNAPAVFKIKLVDAGTNGTIDWPTNIDDTEHELTFDENTMNTGSWVSIDIPLSDFINLTTKEHLAQMVISADPNTVYVDNIYFHK